MAHLEGALKVLSDAVGTITAFGWSMTRAADLREANVAARAALSAPAGPPPSQAYHEGAANYPTLDLIDNPHRGSDGEADWERGWKDAHFREYGATQLAKPDLVVRCHGCSATLLYKVKGWEIEVFHDGCHGKANPDVHGAFCPCPKCLSQHPAPEPPKPLDRLRALNSDWNSYGAPAIDPRAISVAESILGTPGQATPTNQGGVQIEWHCGGVDLEFVINPRWLH